VSSPTRFFLADGNTRCYQTDKPGFSYPGVTSILGRTNSAKAEKALQNWIAKNPGARDAAASRGTNLHAAAEAYVRGRPITTLDDPEHAAFWGPEVEKLLDSYEGIEWSERPLRPDWSFAKASDGVSRIWSHTHRYAGCPDFIGTMRGGIYSLDDIKSSNGPYCRYYPKDRDRSLFTGWRKFQKCAMQIAAYAIAAQETLDIRINQGRIIVIQANEKPQCFTLRGDELAQYKQRWLQRVRQYWDLVEAEAATADLPTGDPSARAFWELAKEEDAPASLATLA